VRYTVCAYVPGSRVAFRFDAGGLTTGFDGFHALALFERRGELVLRHELVAECTAAAWLRWVLGVRVLHDALVEDALDRAALATGGAPQAVPWSTSVRVLRRVAARAPS
jgi:hypothetical protein